HGNPLITVSDRVIAQRVAVDGARTETTGSVRPLVNVGGREDDAGANHTRSLRFPTGDSVSATAEVLSESDGYRRAPLVEDNGWREGNLDIEDGNRRDALGDVQRLPAERSQPEQGGHLVRDRVGGDLHLDFFVDGQRHRGVKPEIHTRR